MRTMTMAIPIATALLSLAAAAPWAGPLRGTVRLGHVFVDETGDRSAVQETYDLEEGFAVSRIQLTGTSGSRSTLALDVRDINLRSRAGDVALRVPGRLRLAGGYDQNRYVFDPARGVTSERKDWRASAQFTARRWLSLSADFNRSVREGERRALPAGTRSVLGERYDDRFMTGQVGAEVRSGRVGVAASYRMSDYADWLNDAAARRGRVVSARMWAPMPFHGRWNNLLRGSYGTRELTRGGVEWTLAGLQFTSILQPRDAWQLRYALDASRVEDESDADNRTDRVLNDVDLTWFHRYGRLSGGFGYETHDDDRSLTTATGWRAGASLRPNDRIDARVDYAGRVRKDEESLTLLQDVEASRLRARLEVRPIRSLTVGGDLARRERELPDIGVSADGTVTGALVRVEIAGWGSLSGDFSHSEDEFTDLAGGFETVGDVVTGRAEIVRFPGLRLAGGVAYLDYGGDLDLEKSTVFAEAALRLAGRYHLSAKYNCYNYDDYILLDRYYTANVVRVELGYDLQP